MSRRPLFFAAILFCALAWSVARAEEPDMPAIPKGPHTTPPRLTVHEVTKPPPTPTPIVVSKNLVVNGDFEKKRPDYNSPTNWDLVDNLVTFYEKIEGRGNIIRIDTTVPKQQARDRWQEMIKFGINAPPPPPKGKLESPEGYDAIGAVDGVHYFSDPIPIRKGAWYKLSLDCIGSGDDLCFLKIFVKGYGMVTKKRNIRQPDGSVKEETVVEERQVFKWYLACRNTKREWKHFEDWIPCPMPQNVDKVKICLFPYWPIQDFYFDNVQLFEGKDPPAPAKTPVPAASATPAASASPTPSPTPAPTGTPAAEGGK
ncbi:MAG: hypothetical protein WC712_07045 [Candidatus Brocadiia bacterium]